MANSTHKVEVVPLQLIKHPDADRLSIAKVYDYECVVATDAWVGHAKAAYIQSDTLVPVSRPEFAFLASEANHDGYYRVRAKKLRGVKSFGLLVPVPHEANLGDDLADYFGCKHYDPPVKNSQMSIQVGEKKIRLDVPETVKGPDVPEYDLEAGKKYRAELELGEPVLVFEKCHGSQSKFCLNDGVMYCGSKSGWKAEYVDLSHLTVEYLVSQGCDEEKAREVSAAKKEPKRNTGWWWKAHDDNPCIRAFCEKNPGYVLYGEIIGNAVQGGFPYGVPNGKIGFLAFDVMKDGRFLPNKEARELAAESGVPWVPLLGEIPFDPAVVAEMAEGQTTVPGASHIREGCVVQPVNERSGKCGRLKLKWVGLGYLTRKEQNEPATTN